jgi:double-strand break repair protein MRE11
MRFLSLLSLRSATTATKKTPGRKKAELKQTTLKVASTRATSGRTAASRAKGKMAEVVRLYFDFRMCLFG